MIYLNLFAFSFLTSKIHKNNKFLETEIFNKIFKYKKKLINKIK